jgi:acetate kinase
MKILVLNAGSSSQKSCLYEIEGDLLPIDPPEPVWQAQIDWNHQADQAKLKVKTASGEVLEENYPAESRSLDPFKALQTLWSGKTQVIANPQAIDIVGHRVVHGGEKYRQSVWIDADVKAQIDRLSAFAPIHNPVNLAGIESIEQIFGTNLPQVAVFDTAFHANLPPAAYVYPGAYEWLEQGIRRYGFHGISHQYCAHRAAQILDRDLLSLKLITCHLGNGCSLAAIRNGDSIDTTMGFTPLDGLMMGTRSGSIDPGILIHLLRHSGCTVDELDRLLNHDSGLLGISGISNDLRQITEAMVRGDERAKLAFDLFVHRLRSNIGAMLASLGGVDALVFTAGIGENSAAIRAAACEAFEFLGLSLDLALNNSPLLRADAQANANDLDISQPDAQVRVLVIHTEEDWAIAQECHRLAIGLLTNSSSQF